MKPAMRVTQNSFLRNYYAKRIKADGSFAVFFFLPLYPTTLRRVAEVNAISPASLSMPLTYYIVFSYASPKFPVSLIKPKLPLFFRQSDGESRRAPISRKIRTIASETRVIAQ